MNKLARTILKPVAFAGARVAARAFGHVVTTRGEVYAVPRGISGGGYLSLALSRYEVPEKEILKRFQPDDTIIEIGSNIGVVARAAFQQCLTDGGRIVCVEPNPRSLRALQKNMSRAANAHPTRAFEIVNVAVSCAEQEKQTARFCVRNNLSSGLRDLQPKGASEELMIPTRSLSGLMQEYAPGGASLICDAEGAEIPMIFNDPDGFAHVRQIAIELHETRVTGRPETPAMMLDGLKRLGFSVGAREADTYYLSRRPV